jgi:hypothetical protein
MGLMLDSYHFDYQCMMFFAHALTKGQICAPRDYDFVYHCIHRQQIQNVCMIHL